MEDTKNPEEIKASEQKYNFDLCCIDEIYLGKNSDEELKQYIKEVSKNYNITIKKTLLNDEEFKLKFDKII